jgi:chromosomal replication initiator protein
MGREIKLSSVNTARKLAMLKGVDKLPLEHQFECIGKIVAIAFSVTLEQMRGTTRCLNISFPRQVAIYLCRQLTLGTHENVVEFFGMKQHKTGLWACESVERLCSDNPEARERLTYLQAKCKAALEDLHRNRTMQVTL